MLDLLLGNDGDLMITPEGDIRPAYSIPQAVLVRLRWIEQEWRLGPAIGFPWFTQVFKKNPSIDLITQSIRKEIMDVDGVKEATVKLLDYDPAKRSVSFRYWAKTNTETYVEEVELNA